MLFIVSSLFAWSREVIEEREAEPGRLKELVLVIDWKHPLLVVVVVDAVCGEEWLTKNDHRAERTMWRVGVQGTIAP